VEGNDLVGNKLGALLNGAISFTGFVIRNNSGLKSLGAIKAPAFPLSGSVLVNNTSYDAIVYITSGAQPIAIALNGTTLSGVVVPGGGAVGAPIRLAANQNITLTYAAGGIPSWQWIAE
jgi:hypothetical protein